MSLYRQIQTELTAEGVSPSSRNERDISCCENVFLRDGDTG